MEREVKPPLYNLTQEQADLLIEFDDAQHDLHRQDLGPLEMAYVQENHKNVVEACMDNDLLWYICRMRDLFLQRLKVDEAPVENRKSRRARRRRGEE